MKRTLLRLTVCAFLIGSAQGQEPPAGASFSQWVREDLFAGFMGDSKPEFERGVGKVDAYLKAHPGDSGAMAWKGSSDLYLAVRARESKKDADYEKLFAKAMAEFEHAYQSASADDKVSALAVAGGTAVVLGDRLAPENKAAFFTMARDRFIELERAQITDFTKMPVHHQGEVLGGLAQMEQRLGNLDGAAVYAQRIVATLADSPYAKAAQAFIADPTARSAPQLACMTCHEEGRLANVIAARK